MVCRRYAGGSYVAGVSQGIPLSEAKDYTSNVFLPFLRYLLERFQQEVVQLLDTGDLYPLIGRMHVLDCRPDGDGVHVGILADDRPALQPGVNGGHRGFLPVHLLVHIFHQEQDR